MGNLLDEEYAKKDHSNWAIKGSDLEHVFATVAGKKPLTVVNMGFGEGYTDEDIKDFVISHGGKVLTFRTPVMATLEDEQGPYTTIGGVPSMLIYMDDSKRDEFISTSCDYYSGAIGRREYNKRLGQVFGYPEAEIERFLAAPHQLEDSHIDYELFCDTFRDILPRAVQEQMAKDPVFSSIMPQLPELPQRPRSG